MKKIFSISLLLLTAFFCSCKDATLGESLKGVYLANIPDGEFLLVAPEKGDAYCVVCRNSDIDSIRVFLDEDIIKDVSGNTLAELRLENDSMVGDIVTVNGDKITSAFTRRDLVAADKPIPTKHPIRYLEPITEDTAQVDRDVFYSRDAGFYSSNSVGDIPVSDYDTYIDSLRSKYQLVTKDIDLFMDVYYLGDDTVSKRPLVILLHGGAFLFGDKGGSFMRHLAQHYATRGFVVASVNYRLGCSFVGLHTIRRTIYRAVQDAGKAAHFLIDHAEDYGIDTNAIFLVGHSAGAITALMASILTDEDNYEDIDQFYLKELGDLPAPVKLLGTVGLWGGITELDYINRADDPDFLLMHGTDDDIVPFREGVPFFHNPLLVDLFLGEGDRLRGSGVIKEEMDRRGLPCELYRFEGMNHDPHLDEEGKFNDNIDIVDSITTSFLYRKLDKLCSPIEVSQDINFCKRYRISSDAPIRQISWNVRGGLIFDSVSDNEIECYMFTNAPSSEVTATVLLENGHTVTKVAR